MRVDALHRRIIRDAKAMHETVGDNFPVLMPEQYLSRQMNLKRFLSRLNTATEDHGVFNEVKEDMEVLPGDLRITGLWLPKGDLPENDSYADIRVLWHVNPETKLFNLTKAEWARRYYYFWQITMHELTHRHQCANDPNRVPRTYKVRSTQRDLKEEQVYFGSYDEIEAHSHDAALELILWWGHLSFRDAVHEAMCYNGRFITPTYCFYAATFCETPKHPAMKAFKQKLRQWYDWMQDHREFYDAIQLPNIA